MPNEPQGMGWGDIGASAAVNAADSAMSMLTGWYNDKRQLKQQQKLQDMQIAGNKQMMDYQQTLAYDMWQKTNYQAQIEQMKKAGLSPGLIYGKGGPGGTMGSPGGSVSGTSAPNAPVESMGLLQGMMMKAQIENIRANTEKTKVDAEKTAGVDTQAVLASIDKMAQETDNLRWDWELKQVDLAIKNVERYVKQETIEKAVEMFKADTDTKVAQMKSAMVQAGVDQATIDRKIEQVNANLALTQAEIALKKQGIIVNQVQMDKMRNDMAVALRSVDVQEKQQKLNEWVQNLQAQFPGISQATGRILNDAVESVFKLSDIKREPHYKK